jgi:hypothetical protein
VTSVRAVLKTSIPLFQIAIGSSAVLLLAFLNLLSVVDLTIDTPLLLFGMNAMALVILSLLPPAMLRDGAIDSLGCSRLYLALAVGLILGGLLLLGLGAIWRLIFQSYYTDSLLATASALIFLVGYSMIFWGLHRQIAEKSASGKLSSPFDATNPRNFGILLIWLNVFVVFPVVVLIFSSNYLLVAAVAIFLAGTTLLGTRLQAWSVSKAGLA